MLKEFTHKTLYSARISEGVIDMLDNYKKYPAMVALVVDKFSVVINRGSEEGVKIGDRFMLYELSDEIIDPETNKAIGRLEIAKGTGQVMQVQEHISLVRSDRKHVVTGEIYPFDQPSRENLVKPI